METISFKTVIQMCFFSTILLFISHNTSIAARIGSDREVEERNIRYFVRPLRRGSSWIGSGIEPCLIVFDDLELSFIGFSLKS